MEDLSKIGEALCDQCEINPAIYACKNNKEVIYLGICCADEHFQRTDCNHFLVELEPIEIKPEEIKEEQKIKQVKNGLALRELNQALLNYLGTVQAFKDRVKTVKKDVEDKILQAVSSSLNTLELLESDVKNKLELMDSDKKKTQKLVEKYEKHGLSGVLSEYYKYLEDNYETVSDKLDELFYIANEPQEVNNDTHKTAKLEYKIHLLQKEIENQVELIQSLRNDDKDPKASDYLTNRLSHYKKKFQKQLDKNQELSTIIEDLQTEIADKVFEVEKFKLDNFEKTTHIEELKQGLSSPIAKEPNSGYIYIPRECTKKLIRYNISTQSYIDIDCTRVLRHNFNGTSVCVLSSEDVIIAGGRLPNRGDVYLYKVAEKRCKKLPSLSKPRGHICLVYHREILYAIGGDNEKPLRDVECLKMNSKKWMKLSKMNAPRNFCSGLGHEDSIFAIGGFNTDTIERFDIITNSWMILRQKITVNGSVTGVMEDKVYIICKDTLFITDLNLNILETKRKCWNKSVRTLSNVVKGKDSIYYYNRNCSKIEKFKSISCALKEVCSIQLVT